MTNKNKHAKHYTDYGIIHDGALPDGVRDAISGDDGGGSNGTGTIVNPKYHPVFAAWLESEEMPLDPYIIWWSW